MWLLIIRGNRTGWGLALTLTRAEDCHYMYPCTHFAGSRTSSRADTTITGMKILCRIRTEWNQLSSEAPFPPTPTQPLIKICIPGKKWNQHSFAAQILKPWPQCKQKWRLASHPGVIQLPQGPCSSPSGPAINPAPVTAIKHRRNPDLYLALALALALISLNPALSSNKAVDDTATQSKSHPLCPSDPVLSPKWLDTCRPHRDSHTTTCLQD